MKFYVAPLLLALFVHLTGMSQREVLIGSVSIHNSGHETGTTEFVNNAQISADFSVPAKTDQFGRFQLEFSGLESGTSVTVQVDKDPLEVINHREMMDVVIGRKAPIRIFMSEKGQLIKKKTEFYNICLKANTDKFNRRIASLQKEGAEKDALIKQLEEKHDIQIKDLSEVYILLQEEFDEVRKRLPEYAKDIAYTNLDFASELYVKAHDLFVAGEVERALETLDILSLKNFEKEARENIRSGKNAKLTGEQLIIVGEQKLEQVIENYQLKAILHRISFEFEEVIDFYTQIIAIQEDFLPNDNLNLADSYDQLSQAYGDLGKYTKALEFQMKANTIYKQRLDQERIGNSYDKLSMLHVHLDRLDDALAYAEKSIAIREKVLAIDDPLLAESYSHIGIVYLKRYEPDTGLTFLHKSIDILELQPDSNLLTLASSYNNIAIVYKELRNYEVALEYHIKSIRAKETILKPDDLSLASSYNNISNVYRSLKKFEEALDFAERSIAIREPVLPANHPSLAKSYNNIGLVYRNTEEYLKALEYMNKSIAIREEIYQPNHDELAIAYSNISRVYQGMERYDRALEYLLKAAKIDESRIPRNEEWLAVDYFKIAEMYYALENYDEALEYANTSMLMLEQQRHFFLGRCYKLLSLIHKKIGNLEDASAFDAKAKATKGGRNN